MVKIYPSLISANPLHLGTIIQELEPHCAGFHLDVMDNHFVPNLTFGADIVNEVDKATKKPSWVHLMVEKPEEWCDRLTLKEGSIISFHFEATRDAAHLTKCISEKKWIPSIAIKPKTNATETEMKEKKDRIEDALHATRAAVEEGIVAGGGIALLRAQAAVDALTLEGDEKLGAQIIRRALEEPLRIIASNAGFDAAVVINKAKSEAGNIGFDAKTGEYTDLVDAGIIDPAKVTRSAIQHAASIAGLLLTTEASISDIPQEKKDATPQAPGMGGMGGMGGMPGMY
jgi:hypothetical protein